MEAESGNICGWLWKRHTIDPSIPDEGIVEGGSVSGRPGG